MPELITIDDSNYRNFLNPIVAGQRRLTGYLGMYERPAERAAMMSVADVPEIIPPIPEDEVDDRLRQIEKDNTRLDQMCLDMGLEVLDQDGTNYCWENSPAFMAMIIRMQEMCREVRYSPASVAGPITGFKNNGGYGINGVKYMAEHGINLQEHWSPNAIDRSLWTEENKKLALLNRVTAYLRVDTPKQEIDCICARLPVSGGYDWWRHQVTTMHIFAGTRKKRIGNSWSPEWSQFGYGDLDGSKKNADDMVVIIELSPL